MTLLIEKRTDQLFRSFELNCFWDSSRSCGSTYIVTKTDTVAGTSVMDAFRDIRSLPSNEYKRPAKTEGKGKIMNEKVTLEQTL